MKVYIYLKKSALKFILFLLLLTGIVACNEDTIEPNGQGSIRGVVIDAETNRPVEAVSITTNPATSAVITDAEGVFSITNIARGNYTISAQKLGYKTKTATIAVRNAEQSDVTLVLEETQAGGSVPALPGNPDPEANATGQPIDITLSWQAPDTVNSDSLTYDVFLYESGSTDKRKIAEAVSDTSVAVRDLMYNTTYFWQVVVKDNNGRLTNGEVWSFTTVALPEARYLFARATDGDYNVYSSDGTEANTFRLTSEFSREWWPVLNPQRDVIAYSSNIGIEPQIFSMNRDGSNKRQITSVPVAGYHNQGIGFVWSPDGGQLLYPNYNNLYRIERDGSGLTLIATAPANRHFRMMDWTGSGDKIAAQTIGANINDSEIYIMNADGSGMELLVGNLPGRVESPAFSIDGNNILYTHDASGFENLEGRQLNAHIYRINTDGSGLIDLSRFKPEGTNDLYPRYSPDGSKIIFVNTPNDNLGPHDIYIMDASDGRNRVKLFSNATMPDWE
ncbi:carboxypeptidase-like regulatory domain-containing protein [Pontibacter pamirensis]|uniref:carboxypeptidase-like regulatory domain-containing protein n=1 Tax=Pontibacter pamirensis TaxID=2562824 RepID=UPI001389AA71|nr:carboxypeptidase-like regulatory domain-containing protein [Pontibacter pamirensis]